MLDPMFLIKFDPKTGERASTIPCDDDITSEKAAALIADGYELVPYADWNLVIGNVDGQEYIRDVVHGGYIVKPPEVPSLEEAKAAKISELKEVRNAKELMPVNNFDVDEHSITRLQIAQEVLSKSNQTIAWTMADNSVKAVTADDIAAVFTELAIRSAGLHEIYRELKVAVMAATTYYEAEAIHWPEE